MSALSIIIPSHRRADMLRRCLASVARFAPAGTEIIVVDDASADWIVSRTASRFPQVRLISLSKHSGFCVAANAGVRAASNSIVELLNDDVEVTAGWVEAALPAFDNPAIAAVAPLVLKTAAEETRNTLGWHAPRFSEERATRTPCFDEPLVDSAGDRYFVGGIAAKRGHNERLRAELLQPGFVFGASASSAFYRRDAFLAVGGLPETFGSYFDDVDLAFRLHWAGHRIWYAPASQVWHRVGASHDRKLPHLLAQQSRNEERVFWRNLPTRQLLRALPRHLAIVAAKAWRRWRRGELLPFLRGRFAVLWEMRELIRHRRKMRTLGPALCDASWRVEDRFWP